MLGKYKISKHEAVIEDYDRHRTLVSKTRLAYADVEPQRSDGYYGAQDPCFHFTTPGWFEDGIALRCAFDAIDGAGTFDAEEVTPVTRRIGESYPNSRVAVGRWHSPVLYVETDYPTDVRRELAGVVATADRVERDEVGVATNIKNNGDTERHDSCTRNAPVVPHYSEARPADGKSVVIGYF